MDVKVYAVGRPDLAPLVMPERFRTDVAYFKTPSGEHGVPPLPPGEHWVRREDAQTWLADGVLEIVSPLDSEHPAEVELTEEQEAWLEWMVQHRIEHIRLA